MPNSVFEEVNLFFDAAADRLGLEDGLRQMLKRPWRELLVQVPVRMDDGKVNVFNVIDFDKLSFRKSNVQ